MTAVGSSDDTHTEAGELSELKKQITVTSLLPKVELLTKSYMQLFEWKNRSAA